MADLGAHDISNLNSIAIVLIIRIPNYDDPFTWAGTTPVKAYTNDLCGNDTYWVLFSMVSRSSVHEGPRLCGKEHTIED